MICLFILILGHWRRWPVPLGQFFDWIHALVGLPSFVYVALLAVDQVPASLIVNFLLLFVVQSFENRVQHDLEQTVQHVGDDVHHAVVVEAYVGIRVRFDEPDAEVLVNHEIEAEEFEGVAPLARVYRILATKEAVEGEVLHPQNEVAMEI